MKKQIRLAKKDATDEEIDRLAKDPEAVSKLMEEQVIGNKAHSKVKNTVSDIQKKYEAILALEKSVNELFDLFQELGQLIQVQGEMLDNIEANLAEANDYVTKAEQNLTNAAEMHKQNRSKMCYIIVFMIILGAVLVCWWLGVF